MTYTKTQAAANVPNNIVSVLDFGADPTGATPSDDAFENALAASRKVFVPFGTYKITKPIQITKSYQALIGDDSLPTIYHENSDQSQAIEFVANDGFVLQYNVIKNLYIQGNQTKDVNYPTAGSAGPQHAAISLSSISRDAYGFATTLIENVRMGHFPIGIYNHGTVDATFRRNRVQWLSAPKGTPAALAICAGYFFRAERMADGRSPQASCTVDQCLCGWSTTPDTVNSYGVYLVGDDLRDIWIYDLNLATCKYGIWIEGNSSPNPRPLIAANDIHISKPIIDKSEFAIYVKDVNQNSAVSINGGWFTNKRDSTVPLVRIENSRGVTLSDFQIFGTLSSTSRGIQLDSLSENNSIKAGTVYDQNEGIILNNVQHNHLSDISVLQSEAFGANNFTTGVFILGGATDNTLSNIYINGGSTRPYTQGFRIGANTPNNTLENCTAGEFVTTPYIISDASTFFTSQEKGTTIYRSLPTSSVDLEKGGLYSSGGNLKIVDDNPDTVSVKDFGVSPDNDGETNKDAFNAAATYAANNNKVLYAPAGVYYIEGTVEFTNNQTSGVAGFGLVGAGTRATTFIQLDNDADTFTTRCTTDREFHTIATFSDFSVEYQDVESTDTGAAIRVADHNGSKFSQLYFRGAPYGIIGERLSHCHFEHIYHYLVGIKDDNHTQAFLKLTGRPGNSDKNSFGNFVDSCECQGPSATKYGLWLQSSDGLYVTNSHLNCAEKTVYINPVKGESPTVRQVLFSNCYFDADYRSQLPHVYHVNLQPSGSAGDKNTTIFGIQFTGCIFRGNGSNVVNDGATRSQLMRYAGNDFSTACDLIADVSFVGNVIMSYVGEVVNASVDAAVTDRCKNITFSGNTIRSTYTTTGPIIRGNIDNVSITGNLIDLVTNVELFINGSGAGNNWLISDNTFGADVVSTRLADFNFNPTCYFKNNNVSIDNTHLYELSGTDANGGTYFKYEDGTMICTRQYTVTGDIDTQFQGSSDYASENLMSNTYRDYPHPFISTPIINAQIVSPTGHDLITCAAGSFSETQWMSSIKAVRFNTATDVEMVVNLTATGRWK